MRANTKALLFNLPLTPLGVATGWFFGNALQGKSSWLIPFALFVATSTLIVGYIHYSRKDFQESREQFMQGLRRFP